MPAPPPTKSPVPSFQTAMSVVAPAVQPGVFRSRAGFRSEHPRALALYCSDGRFTEAVEELLHALGHDRLDTLTLPGGPGLLNTWAAQITDLDAVRRASSFLIEGHALTDVVLLAHAGCGYYRARFANRSADELVARQLHDLRVAASDLRLRCPGVKIQGFFARPESTTVVFDAVDLASETPLPIG
jgi:hypothetical protein